MTVFLKKILKFAYQCLSAINGAVGDKLENTLLGIEMNFYENLKPIPLTKKHLSQQFSCKDSSNQLTDKAKICILIHGLTHNETIWAFDDKSDYGTMLEKDFQYTPFYLRYNTGLHISENGKSLAALIEKLTRNAPTQISEICIIAHSMGGLVTHSACHYAQENQYDWVKKLSKIFLLATPHLGSYLEKFANITTNILAKVPNWHTRMVGKVINLRSSGIKDLRYGYIKDEDWKGHHPDQLLKNTKTATKKLSGVSYYVISGRLTKEEMHWVSQLFGDILVDTKSATARSKNVHEFNFLPENHYEFASTHHFKLSAMPEVYEKINYWIQNG
jgi:pimeloyl-ACP methyl ester carboxylesterase